jgi:hypothetical protein
LKNKDTFIILKLLQERQKEITLWEDGLGEFCTKEDALAYVAREWCSAVDVNRLWPEMDNNDGLPLSEMEERMPFESKKHQPSCRLGNLLNAQLSKLCKYEERAELSNLSEPLLEKER